MNKNTEFINFFNSTIISIFTTYTTSNVSARFCCNNGNCVFLHVVPFEQILAVIIRVVILNKMIIILCYRYSNHLISKYTLHVYKGEKNTRQESTTNLADVDSIVSGLHQLRGIRREMVRVHELLSTCPILFLQG